MPLKDAGAPYLQRIQLLPERVKDGDRYPFTVPGVLTLDVSFRRPVTFLVGENGSGKSTIIEAIAGLLKLPLSGGGTTDKGLSYGPNDDHDLASALRPSFRRRPRDTYFFRGEFVSHFAQLLDERKADTSFGGDPYARYGNVPILQRSHGEGFLAIMQNRIGDGLYLLDEPEAALSPQRLLVLMAILAERANNGAQLIVATHSPILMTVPNADILLIEDGTVRRVLLEETEHYQVTKAVLTNPAVFWKHLKPTASED